MKCYYHKDKDAITFLGRYEGNVIHKIPVCKECYFKLKKNKKMRKKLGFWDSNFYI